MYRKHAILFLLTPLVSLAFTACLSTPSIAPNPANPLRTVAVLPMLNNTTDVEGPLFVRQQLVDALTQHAYVVTPLAEVDQILKDQMGVTLGTQLDMASSKMLAEALGVDSLLYTALDDFSHNVTGLYNSKRVCIRAKLVDKNSETVWSNGIGVQSSSGTLAGSVPSRSNTSSGEGLPLFGTKINVRWLDLSGSSGQLWGGDIRTAAIAGFADKVIMKAMKKPLFQETRTAVNGLLEAFPAGPGTARVVTGSSGILGN